MKPYFKFVAFAAIFTLCTVLFAENPAWVLTVEGNYPFHLQGVDRNGENEYFWSFTEYIVKTDSNGKVLLRKHLVSAPLHLGDLCSRNGYIYVTCTNIPDYSKDCRGSTIRVYSQKDLSFVMEYPVSLKFGCDGICTTPEGFAVAIGCGSPNNNEVSQIFEYDGEFNLRKLHEFEHKPTYSAIQCLKRLPNGGYVASLYGLLILLDGNFKVNERKSIDAGIGIIVENENTLLRAVHHRQHAQGWEVHLERVELADNTDRKK